MKVLIVILAVFILCIANEININNHTSYEQKEGTVEDVIREFEEAAARTKEAIAQTTSEVIELAKEPITKSLNETENLAKDILKDGEAILEKYTKIKMKIDQDLKRCKDKFMRKTNGHRLLLDRAQELEILVKEIKNCSTDDISGMGCTLSKLIRGEGFIEEIENQIEKLKETPERIDSTSIESIEVCMKDAIRDITFEVKAFVNETRKCTRKDEL